MYEFAVDIYVGCVHWLPQYFYFKCTSCLFYKEVKHVKCIEIYEIAVEAYAGSVVCPKTST